MFALLGLKFIHESGVIHLDLKLANIFLAVESRFKMGGFSKASFFGLGSSWQLWQDCGYLQVSPIYNWEYLWH